MQLLGNEFDFSFTDIDDLERFEQAYAQLQDIPESGTQVQTLRAQCAGIRAFLEDVLGAGAYEVLVTKPNDIACNLSALYAFADAYEAAADELKEMQAQRESRLAKYAGGKRRK